MLHAMLITFGVLLAIVMFPLLLGCGVWLLGVGAVLLRMLFVDYFWIWWIAAFAVPALCIWGTGGSFGSDDTTQTLGGLILILFIGIGCLGKWLHKKIYPYGF